ncbi:MAG: ABC transporter permease subunit [Hydrogenophaga sp.]|uniref:ABC transporter permease n=1 Tax=Hydrogenophaga sp. TaxID=1904254 RepID=UPI001698D20B|nr:ABC transporter permease [Hydrogenophaga sp.]NIM41893.1 ABC transporter permease subunit [Hydrogenophaga sp.]NIN27196.1 ABC transporter permease subunit [Hydrogenophaga sp.]NIN31897.1 ABC transporter permease subunit [Hydrogenophaga sp.]NIN56290.1 ABC transporter permease subunit [Hydrogenophaga sp.]NIO52270.1 ABC transporter permease subunit [Hydrogenophaga sp.]
MKSAWPASLALLVALIALWWAASLTGWFSPAFLPTPPATAASLAEGLRGELLQASLATIGRMLQGWLLAAVAGITLGATIASSATLRPWVQPTLEFLRPLPASAVMPLAIALYGLSPAMVLSVVAFGSLWPTLLATVHGVAAVEPRLLDVARCLRLSRAAFLWKMGLPNAVPDILAGLRLSLTVALIVSTLGEMLASQDGLGLAILIASRAYRASELFACLVLLSLIGLTGHALLALAGRWLLRGQRH